MAKRKSITKKMRFEIFKRDSFTCQYCGKKAPDVLLQIDHVKPVAKGGTNDFLNLITSCFECNSGKSDRELSDTTVIDKQREQLEALQERKEQIDLMFQWQKGLAGITDDITNKLAEFWIENVPGFHFTDHGLKTLKRLHRRFEIGEIMEAMQLSIEYYVKYDEEGEPTSDSVSLAIKRVGGICNTKRKEKVDPHIQKIYYIRGILRNRLGYVNERVAFLLLKEAASYGLDLYELEEHAKTSSSWTQWKEDIEEFMHEKLYE